MSPGPKVTVLMAVHNGMPYLSEAVDSILGQSFRDFEFLVIDDASTDGSLDLLHKYSDKRIRIISNMNQLELARSLNLGIDSASGDYIARMDHDDISLPTRLAEQVRFLDTHSEIDVVGTDARTIGAIEQVWSYPKDDDGIRSEFIFNSALVHSSVMIRNSTFKHYKLRYDPEFKRAQDYELWTRSALYLRFANLNKELVRYRIHENQIGNKQAVQQQKMAKKIRDRELLYLGIQASEKQAELHNRASVWDFLTPGVELDGLERWFLELDRSNRLAKHYPIEAFRSVLESRWWAACRANIKMGLESWLTYSASPLSKWGKRNILSQAKFIGKALLRELRGDPV